MVTKISLEQDFVCESLRTVGAEGGKIYEKVLFSKEKPQIHSGFAALKRSCVLIVINSLPEGKNTSHYIPTFVRRNWPGKQSSHLQYCPLL